MSFEIPKELSRSEIRMVKIGATAAEGGSRTSTVTIGGTNTLPFHWFEGEMPHRPVIAMEVFDSPPKRYPATLMEFYGDVIDKPAEMAKRCVQEFGAELISVRSDGTHPDRGDKTPEEAAYMVKQVLESVGVPLIITGHSHFKKNNEVMRKVAEVAAGENCLINWVEKDNYKTIAAVCLAHGHCVVAQSPIDVNIAKQLNIQLTSMAFPAEKIVIDPLSSPVGYGLEYTYSIMERIRLDGLAGDDMLRMPMLVTPGYESTRCKEAVAPETDYPKWGSEKNRSAQWEIATAMSLLLAGADLLVMYHPKAVETIKKIVNK
jgi:acetyl-CoA decarbonylase/synthase complex subunit delta